MKGEMQKVVEGVAAEGGVWFCDVGWFGGAAVVPSSFGEGFGDAVKDALGEFWLEALGALDANTLVIPAWMI